MKKFSTSIFRYKPCKQVETDIVKFFVNFPEDEFKITSITSEESRWSHSSNVVHVQFLTKYENASEIRDAFRGAKGQLTGMYTLYELEEEEK